jgi:hypothetical protein
VSSLSYELDVYISEDGFFHSHRGENLSSYIFKGSSHFKIGIIS